VQHNFSIILLIFRQQAFAVGRGSQNVIVNSATGRIKCDHSRLSRDSRLFVCHLSRLSFDETLHRSLEPIKEDGVRYGSKSDHPFVYFTLVFHPRNPISVGRSEESSHTRPVNRL